MRLTMLVGSLLPFALLAVTELPTAPPRESQNKNTSQDKPPVLPKLPIKKKQDENDKQGQEEAKNKQAGKETKPGQRAKTDTQPLINPITGRPYLPDTTNQSDLVQRFAPRNPLLGVWRISNVAQPGQRGAPPIGYFVFTQSHVSIHILNPNPTTGPRTAFQSALRLYRIQGNRIVMTSLIGARTGKKANELLLERQGMREWRRFALIDPQVLRIYTGLTSYFELTRIADV